MSATSPYLDFKDAKCKDCFKCLRECPVKAIRYENHQAKIIEQRCILCGRCTLVCPQNAKQVHSELDDVLALLSSGRKVVASLAPSFVSSFDTQDLDVMKEALFALGFAEVEETAVGAKAVTEEYARLLGTGEFKNFITSACPAVNRMISIYYPDALKYLAPVPSPMVAHARMLKKRDPDAAIVFIGPCIAKKEETLTGKAKDCMDYTITFEELLAMFCAKEIDLSKLEGEEMDTASYFGRIFARSGGLAGAVVQALREQGVRDDEFKINPQVCSGIAECKVALLKKQKNMSDVNFIEGMACVQGCIGGPACLSHGIKDKTEIDKYGQSSHHKTIRQAIDDFEK